MSNVYGYGKHLYKYVHEWAKLPQNFSFVECPGVAVDSSDNVYVFTRGEHPIIVFDQEGNFLRTFGEGFFSNRTHGLFIAYDDSVLCVDDGLHTIQKFNLEGEKLMEIGERNHPAPKWSGQAFNRPTSAAIMPSNGDIYISDGYGNSRIHVYSGTGEFKFSWGSPGIDPGQFIRPHNIAIDGNDRVYVVDRECHRVQIFDAQGKFITMWNNIHRPDAMVLWQDHIYIGELNGIAGLEDAPGIGHRIGIYDLNGRRVCRFGSPEEGDGPGQFKAPHAIAVDSRGDIYVAEVTWTIQIAQGVQPKEMRSLSKYARQW
jgi:DNA-binding beta-propeller fold protein YncE